MAANLYFRRQALESLLSGVSLLDAQKISIHDVEQATAFISSYGYDWADKKDQRTMLSFYRQAVAFIGDVWAKDKEKWTVPEELADLQKLGDLRKILIFASDADPEKREKRIWACALLKVMHIITHLNNDLYSVFEEDIRQQILDPIRECIYSDDAEGATMFSSPKADERIRLTRFEIKPAKNQTSAIIKLLAKKRLMALNILDRVGVRFVTRNTFDIFRVVRLLVNEGLVSYPHAMVNESVNTVYPTNLFLETMDALRSSHPMSDNREVSAALEKKLLDHQQKTQYQSEGRDFTDPNYRFVKFISRKIIKIERKHETQTRDIRFFYPFEIQIMDYETHIKNMRGPLSHSEYKKRQLDAAYIRLFGKD